jgi:hypothetical protein
MLGASVALLRSVPAAAAETRLDIETDHIDADVGPRSFGAFAKTGLVDLESSKASAGLELDFALGDMVVLGLAGDWLPLGARVGHSVTLGLPVFPGRIPFHGLCVHPRLTWARAAVGEWLVDQGSAGATVGWEWTARAGLTARIEAGLVYEGSFGGAGEAPGVRPAGAAALGWVF